jgi:replication factor C subunit 3/5
MSAQPNLLVFPIASEPESLTERYSPASIADFCGLAKVKETLAQFVVKPYKSSWIFKGDSGTGKSSLARIVAREIDAEIIHVPAQECTVDRLRDIVKACHYAPLFGQRFRLVLIDEADSMSRAAQTSLLSVLDHIPVGTVFVFTCNSTESFEPRFMSRSRLMEFSNYGIQKDAAELLAEIWKKETNGKTAPNIARIVKESNGNIRAALMALELEIMTA